MRRGFTIALLLFSLCCSFQPVGAYTLRYTDTSGAVRVRWPSNTITVTLSSSLLEPPANLKATGSEAQTAVLNALRRWEKAANITFVVAGSNKAGIAGGDNVNLITVAHGPENAKLFTGIHARDVARARTLHDDNGALTEADIALNPSQLFSTDGTPGTYDLEATFAHEIGHLLGLGESSVMGATMSPRQGWNGLYHSVSWAGRTLSADDVNGVAALYGPRNENEPTGVIFGNLTWPGGQPAAGVNVWAEEWRTGRVIAGGITLSKGEYRLEGLPQRVTYRVCASLLSGPLSPADFGLPALDISFGYAEEVRLVTLNSAQIYVPKQLREPSGKTPQPSLVGWNGELADVSLALTAGQTYTLFLSGANLTADKLDSISVGSPYFKVSQNTIKFLDDKAFTGLAGPVLSFSLTINADAPEGDYSLRLENSAGLSLLPGALTVESASFARRPSAPKGSDTLAAKPHPDNLLNGTAILLSDTTEGSFKEKE